MWRWCWLLIWLPKLSAQIDTAGGRDCALPPVFIEGEAPLRQKRWRRDSLGWPAVGPHLLHLLSQTEGIYLRDYGGQGSLKTLSIRGMGAPLSAITFQGLPLRAPTLGIINLAPFYLSGLQEVTFSPGGDLSTSAGAIGTLHLRWKPTTRRAMLAWQAAAFGEIATEALLERPHHLLQAAALSTRNAYPFSVPEKGRREAPYRYLQATYTYHKNHLHWTSWYFHSEQVIPPPVVIGASTGPPEYLAQSQLLHSAEYATPSFTVRLQHHYESLSHQDALQFHSYSYLHTLQGQVEKTYTLTPLRLGSSLYAAWDYVRSNRMAVEFRPFPTIHQSEVAFIQTLTYPLPKGYLRAEGRWTAFTRFPPQGSLLLRALWQGIGIELLRGVRFPSLWERYWIGYGNPTLRPEESLQAQLFYETQRGPWTVYGAIFLAQTRHRIVTLPLSPVRWQAYSLGYVESLGAEGRISYQGRSLRTWLSGTALVAREYSFTAGIQLPYTPPYTAAAGLVWAKRPFLLIVQVQYVSWRLSSLAATPSSVLPPYILPSLALRYSTPSYRIEMGAENLTNTSYQVLQGYPMPGRRAYLRWEATW